MILRFSAEEVALINKGVVIGPTSFSIRKSLDYGIEPSNLPIYWD